MDTMGTPTTPSRSTTGPDAKRSVLDFVLEHVERRPNKTAALVKQDGRYGPVTWKQMWTQSLDVARALVGLGIQAEDRVSIISHTRLEWVVNDLGILGAGAVTVPIYPSNLAEECKYVVTNSGARAVFCENADQVEKFLAHKDELGDVIALIQMDGDKQTDDPWVLSFTEFLDRGNAIDEASVTERREGLTRDSVLTIIYTSGTTGLPKGVVLTHGNMMYEAEGVNEIDFVRPEDVHLLFLPLAHVFAKVLEVAWLALGHQLAFAESMQTIRQNMAEVRPTLMCGVPRVFEKFYAAVVEKATAADGPRKQMFLAALELSQKNGEAEERGETLGLVDSLKFAVLRRLVFTKIGEGIMEILGGRMRVMMSGGAPLSKKIAWFFRDAGILIVEGYGMTESSAGTCVNLPHRNQIGTVGPALPGTKLEIAEDGEILIQGPGVMREYWNNPEATAETLIDGWLHTGDIGEIDPRTKALRITDRKKDIIVTAGGKNVAPQKIENLLKTQKLISQAVVHGDKRKFLSALITLDPEQLEQLAKERNLAGDYAALTQHPEVEKEVQRILDESNRELASYETIKKFKILEQDFSVETGELTPKLSVKRKVVNSRYGHVLDAFYAEKF